jgi:hypothetical protein
MVYLLRNNSDFRISELFKQLYIIFDNHNKLKYKNIKFFYPPNESFSE